MTSVLVVDDQELVCAGLARILDGEPDLDVVGQAPDGERALSLCRELEPDVVLMDIRMPRLDGISATRQLLDQGSTSGS